MESKVKAIQSTRSYAVDKDEALFSFKSRALRDWFVKMMPDLSLRKIGRQAVTSGHFKYVLEVSEDWLASQGF